MKRLLFLTFLALSMVGIAERPASASPLSDEPCAVSCIASAVGEDAAKDVVYVTRTGSKYHLATCQHVKRSKIKMSRSAAEKQGYTPCKTCLKAATVKQHPEKRKPESKAVGGQCGATTKKGTRCKRKAKAGSNYCWQHG